MNVYSLAIEKLNGKTVRLLVTDDGRALCAPGTYGLGPSRVDAIGAQYRPYLNVPPPLEIATDIVGRSARLMTAAADLQEGRRLRAAQRGIRTGREGFLHLPGILGNPVRGRRWTMICGREKSS